MSDIREKTVCFAEVSDKMRSYKEILIKELGYCGCIIKEVSNTGQDIEKVREIIGQCEIVIHILSDNDPIINSIGRGIEEQQINYSVQHFLSQKLINESSENGFKIFAWHPRSSSGSIFEEEKISRHLLRIQQLEEVELLRTNFEEFKLYLLNQIEADNEETVDEFYIKGNNNICIYFLYDSIDKEIVLEYIEYIKKRGFTVFTPIFDSDIMNARQMHSTCLKKFDFAIIFAKEASGNWVNMKIMDVLKSPGLGRKKNILGKAVFTTEKKGKVLNLVRRGFDFIPIDQNTLTNQVEGFFVKNS